MSQLANLVTTYFPEQHIVKDTGVEFSTSLGTMFGKIGGFSSSPLKIPYVETDTMLFLDVRPICFNYKPWLSKVNPINAFISLIVIVSIPMILLAFIRDISQSSPAFIIFISIVGLFWLSLILRWNRTITNILAIKKDWISKDEVENNKRKITWSMPKSNPSFSFVHLLSEDKKQKLSILVKFQSGMFFKSLYNLWLTKLSPIDFQNVVFTIED